MATAAATTVSAVAPSPPLPVDWKSATDGTAVIAGDEYLQPFADQLRKRYAKYIKLKSDISAHEGGLEKFSTGYEKFGVLKVPGGVSYHEWAPGAKAVYLTGDFNDWNRKSHAATRNEFGVWSLFIPDKADGSSGIPHGSKLKASLLLENGQTVDRIPVWMHYVVQNADSKLFDGIFWNPPQPYQFQHPRPPKPSSLRVYEAHVGMATIHPRVGSYVEFTRDVLPRIKDLGYTAVQLMAVMEHAYYGSFGYHVTNFFAISSRFGTPDELKALIDRAHELGLVVLMDCIHSHASSNVLDGLNQFDGTDHQYFHGGAKGYHTQWDSRLFNYGHWEVLRFLLSNLRWYIDEYRFDGFRFDGITSMLYKNHGINYSFSGGYSEYFNENTDVDSMVYLMLANDLCHSLLPEAITVAEDVSGMPTLCRPVSEGGFGFDYRLAMAVPDKWIQLLKEYRDDDWNMGNIVHTLINRRWNEKCIAYVESHDQSIVGDKTIAFWLMDKEMYDKMGLDIAPTPVIDRGISLHKLIRLITYALGGEGYLNFIGNEFGHPEWVDFPRPGNNFDHNFCRRRWDLADNPNLRYQYLQNFDRAMHSLETKHPWLTSADTFVSLSHEKDKIVVFERAGLLFVFNFHPTKSFDHYRVGTRWGAWHQTLFDTDKPEFGGQNRLNGSYDITFATHKEPWCNRPYYVQLYIPCRTAIVLRPTSYDEPAQTESIQAASVDNLAEQVSDMGVATTSTGSA